MSYGCDMSVIWIITTSQRIKQSKLQSFKWAYSLAFSSTISWGLLTVLASSKAQLREQCQKKRIHSWTCYPRLLCDGLGTPDECMAYHHIEDPYWHTVSALFGKNNKTQCWSVCDGFDYKLLCKEDYILQCKSIFDEIIEQSETCSSLFGEHQCP